jgi:uncharacterized protein YdiU (UPF0061 family)
LLRAVCKRQAALVAGWMHVGFIHGVMNTDNTAVSGETIDFGPCAFMDAYDPATVFSSIDGMGRYAYANQPPAAQWNLARFAETLLALIDADANRAVEAAGAEIEAFSSHFAAHWLSGMRRKFGLLTALEGDLERVQAWLETMRRNDCDFTLTFRRLCDAADPDADPSAALAQLRAAFAQPAESEVWAADWRLRLAREPDPGMQRPRSMRQVNPAFIPRNHRVEQVIAAATEQADLAPFEALLKVLSQPYREQPDFEVYAAPPRAEERVLRTFCGT